MANMAQQQSAQPAGNQQPLIPFVAAAHLHTEPAFDVTATPGANSQQIGPFDVPAYGYMRSIAVLVEASGGTLGAGVFHPDAPFNVLTEVTLLDVNGAPIFGPYTGFQTFLANIYGGYTFNCDLRSALDFATGISFSFVLRIPVEVTGFDGWGSLANQNAAAAYKVRFTMNVATGATGLFTTAPTTPPAVRLRGILEAWTLPAAQDPAGRQQAVLPPRHGTTQFWSVFSKSIVVGDNNILLPRVGNLLRALVIVVRDNTANLNRQTTANLPDPVELRWDQRQLLLEPGKYRRTIMNQQVTGGKGSGTPESPLITGTFFYSFDHTVLGHHGQGSPALLLPTVQSTRLEFHSTTFPAAGTIEILTNDIAPAEVNPNERFVEGSATGFQPAQVTGAGQKGSY